MSNPVSNPDTATLLALQPNLDIGDIADPALRLAAFNYLYAYIQILADGINTAASPLTAGSMSILDKLKLNSIVGTSIPVYSIPVDTEWTVGNFRWISMSATGALELREY